MAKNKKHKPKNRHNLASGAANLPKRVLPHQLKAVSQSRKDIKDYTDAQNLAQSEEPKNFALQLLYKAMMQDALLTSQIKNRKQQTFSATFALKSQSGELDEEQSKILKSHPIYRQLLEAVLDSVYFGYSLVEITQITLPNGNQTHQMELLPRSNTVPQTGLFFSDYTEDKSVAYRTIPEYGTWILEFNSGDFGLLNHAVPHVLFKKFAQSCWSELCEIYGIPPRVMKTNTQDPQMLNRAEQMMRDTGAAAWYIIDELEKFEFAQGVSTKGEVYENLINLCDNQNSLLISGAIIGQDTKFGSKGKEASSQEMLWQLVQADKTMVAMYFNNLILPALATIGVIKDGLTFEFEPAEDTDGLWTRTLSALPYYTVDAEWVKNKFGIEITGERQNQVDNNTLSADFFD